MDPTAARILDANANRAREALRVMEEYARFALADRFLSERIKSLRHALAETFGDVAAGTLVRARDVSSDVGCNLETEAEYTRRDTRDVVVAACKRASEAMRVLEEYAKTIDVDRSRSVERLRYHLYGIEQAVMIRADARECFGRVRLYVLLTESCCAAPWRETAEQAIEGGADCIQLREKTLPDGELLDRARVLTALCRRAGVLSIINDRPDVARLSGADGVHLGQDDLPVAEARRIVGPARLVGISTHTIQQARDAMAASPDYIAVGPMFPSETKPRDDIPGPPLLSAVAAETSLPIVAIGGIDRRNVSQVAEVGAVCACVCRAVIASPDVASAARTLKQKITALIDGGGTGQGTPEA